MKNTMKTTMKTLGVIAVIATIGIIILMAKEVATSIAAGGNATETITYILKGTIPFILPFMGMAGFASLLIGIMSNGINK